MSPFPSDIGPALVASKSSARACPCNTKYSALILSENSFAYLEMTSFLSKVLFKYDLELVNSSLDWAEESRCYVMWWKAPIRIMFTERPVETLV